MKILQKAMLLSVLAGCSVSAMAQVTLNVGANTIVTAINGQEVKKWAIYRTKTPVYPRSGQARYHRKI